MIFLPVPRITGPSGERHRPLDERDLWCEGIDYLARKGPLAFVSITAAFEPVVRELSRKVKSHVALRQNGRECAAAPFGARFGKRRRRDGTPKPGAHIVAPMRSAADRDRLVEAINSSAAYGEHVRQAGSARRGSKELLPEGNDVAGRLSNRHPAHQRIASVAEGRRSGSRVAGRAGRLDPSRTGRAVHAHAMRRTAAAHHAWQFDAEGQGILFAELARYGRRSREGGPARPKIEPAPMLRLFAVVGNVDVLETMKGLGETHEEIARRLGISRPQATNILNGQFRPSRDVVRRVLELARAA